MIKNPVSEIARLENIIVANKEKVNRTDVEIANFKKSLSDVNAVIGDLKNRIEILEKKNS